ncbi:MAG: DNA polymerase III subunit gamma/tau [Pseudomonadales bacterium]|nr:DNA polymerase III subunit gamma/tau [Pseudomonadales bacterium]
MSYQVLARKWRPSNFSQVAGQSHVLKSLINALDNQRLHHAYLFTGTRGVGKTTLARILAKCLNCEEGISSQPCEQCASCQEINEGRFIDLIEVDAASRTKVEDTRELLENVQYSPSRGRFKVYLIDEVHMLSNHSFNALLKTLEEPPSHVKFLFATTDPQKLPITILSRCLQFNLKNLSPKLIVDYLQKVLQEENIEYDEEALWQIAAGAAGSMRDALTLVDQAISYCQGKITKSGVVEMLGVPEQQQVYSLLSAMAAGDITGMLHLVNELSDRSPDYVHTLDGLLSSLHRLAIAQVAPGSIDNSFGDKEQLESLAKLFSAEDIQLFYQIGVKGRADLRAGMDVRSAFEMLLIRMMVFSPTLVNEELKGTLVDPTDAVSVETEDVKKNSQLSEAAQAEIAQVSDDSAEPPRQQLDEVAAEPAAPTVSETEPDTTPASVEQPEAGEEAESQVELSSSSSEEILQTLNQESWLGLFPSLPVTGIAANVFANSQLLQVQDDTFYFRLDTAQSAVFSDEIVPKLEAALSQFFSKPLKVQIEINDVDTETPAQQAARIKKEKQDDLVQQFEQDDNVQELVKRFSASVAVDSITSVEDQRK